MIFNPIRLSRCHVVLLISCALACSTLHAAVIIGTGFNGSFSEVNSSTELAYDGNQSNSDLIDGLTATTATGWNTSNGSTVPELNDGIHGGSFEDEGNTVAGLWTNENAVVEYQLGTGTNGLGYDITSIQSIAAWNGAGFGNQVWTVEVKSVGSISFDLLATVNYTPFASNAGGASKVTLTGLDASGVETIRFTAGSTAGQSFSNDFVFREIDVFGASTIPEPSVALISAVGLMLLMRRRRHG